MFVEEEYRKISVVHQHQISIFITAVSIMVFGETRSEYND